MADPRTALFQRKGAEPSSSNQGPGDESGPAAETGETGEMEMTVCPQCGCEFDPDNPESYVAPQGGAPMEGAPMGGAGEIAGLLGMQ